MTASDALDRLSSLVKVLGAMFGMVGRLPAEDSPAVANSPVKMGRPLPGSKSDF
jgi:hypothetical protein